MRAAPPPPNEKERLKALLEYEILDTTAEQEYDDLTKLASALCQTPIAVISLVDADRQWFKAKIGLDVDGTPRDIAFCAHTICQEGVFVVDDAQEDERFADNPLVASEPRIRFYAGAPLRTAKGLALGTLCAIDRVPRKLTTAQIEGLETLARMVMRRFEMRRTFLEMRASAEKILDLAASKDRFLAILAHDLMSPFASIVSFSEILMNDGDDLTPQEQQAMLGNIRKSGEGTIKLLQNLLRWSLAETGQLDHAPVALHVRSLLARVVELLSGVALKKNLKLEVHAAPGTYVLADQNMLHSVLQNLLFNAIKFTPEGGSIRVSAEQQGSMVEITVTDTGVGMTPEQVHKLFRAQLPGSTQGTGGERGTGLGLLLCQQFVQKNGGTLHVESEPNKGTTFRVSIPPSPPDSGVPTSLRMGWPESRPH